MHVPFCVHRCGYCNFSVIAGRDDLVGSFLTAIELELRGLEQPRQVDTLFIGGGTPTHLAPAALSQFLSSLRDWLPLAAGYEFSVEANPADLDEHRIDVLSEFGVNRLSLGVQSFDPAKLKLLERDHGPDEIARSFSLARRRIASISVDLIFAAPGESVSSWAADLDSALTLQPDHVSTYGLTYERGTAFWSRLRRGTLVSLDETAERDMYEMAIDRLTAAGFEHYEVSNFARPGHRCRHNEVYWAAESYYAFGPGAARYIDGRRETNHRSTTTYLKRVLAGQSPVAESETLSAEDRAREALVLGLRRLEGVDRTTFRACTGFEVDTLIGPALDKYRQHHLLEEDGHRLRLTRDGLLVSDSIWPELLRA